MRSCTKLQHLFEVVNGSMMVADFHEPVYVDTIITYHVNQ